MRKLGDMMEFLKEPFAVVITHQKERAPEIECMERKLVCHEQQFGMFDKRLDSLEKQEQNITAEMKTASSVDTTARNQFAALEKKFEAQMSRVTRLATASSSTTPPRPSSSTSSPSLAPACTVVIGGLERETAAELALETARGFLRHLGLEVPTEMESPYMLASVVTIKSSDPQSARTFVNDLRAFPDRLEILLVWGRFASIPRSGGPGDYMSMPWFGPLAGHSQGTRPSHHARGSIPEEPPGQAGGT